VHEFKSIGYLFYYCGSLFFREFLFLFYVLETAIGKGFEDQIEVIFVMETAK
jgi:hypothetical protein